MVLDAHPPIKFVKGFHFVFIIYKIIIITCVTRIIFLLKILADC